MEGIDTTTGLAPGVARLTSRAVRHQLTATYFDSR